MTQVGPIHADLQLSSAIFYVLLVWNKPSETTLLGPFLERDKAEAAANVRLAGSGTSQVLQAPVTIVCQHLHPED